jgi:hypothetical protein
MKFKWSQNFASFVHDVFLIGLNGEMVENNQNISFRIFVALNLLSPSTCTFLKTLWTTSLLSLLVQNPFVFVGLALTRTQNKQLK